MEEHKPLKQTPPNRGRRKTPPKRGRRKDSKKENIKESDYGKEK